jgi:hypothetical protein
MRTIARGDMLIWVQWASDVKDRRDTKRFRWTLLFVIVGTAAAVIAALEGWYQLEQP